MESKPNLQSKIVLQRVLKLPNFKGMSFACIYRFFLARLM